MAEHFGSGVPTDTIPQVDGAARMYIHTKRRMAEDIKLLSAVRIEIQMQLQMMCACGCTVIVMTSGTTFIG